MLVDTHGRRHTYLRIALTERCNLRCTYCMPADGVPLTPRTDVLTDDEIVRLVRLFVALGVDKVRLTGGEPLVRKHVDTLVQRIGGVMGIKTLALTTNGLRLPAALPALMRAGLSLLNLSLDTLRADRFQRLTRRPGLDRVLAALDAAQAARVPTIKVNCVVQRGVNDDEALDFAELAAHRGIEVRFIEYMPFAGNAWNRALLVPWTDLRDRIATRYALHPLDDGPHETARTFALGGTPGRVGFIASMTAPFCDGCNRLRLTADGHLKVCLFGAGEVSLRDALRTGASDTHLADLVHAALDRKRAAHAGVDTLAEQPNRPMILIGG